MKVFVNFLRSMRDLDVVEGNVVAVASRHGGPLLCKCLRKPYADLMHICAGHFELHKKVQSEDGRRCE